MGGNNTGSGRGRNTTDLSKTGGSTGTSDLSKNGGGANSADKGGNGGGNGTSDITNQCPPNNQRVLILDFKSGWWAGDGGNLSQIISQGLTLQCNSTVTIEYHHVVHVDSPGCLAKEPDGQYKVITDPSIDWNKNYTQLWVLSGASGNLDHCDIQMDEQRAPEPAPILNRFVDKLKTFQGSIFIGAGLASTTHAAVTAENLGLANLFSPAAQFMILNPQIVQMLTTSTRISKAQNQLTDHPLFSRGITSLADDMLIPQANILLKGDALNSVPNVDIIAKNTEGNNSIGVTHSGRKMVFDAGLQRFYSLFDQAKEQDTLLYLQNIIVWLATK